MRKRERDGEGRPGAETGAPGPMTLYGELLKLALADDLASCPEDGIGALIVRLASCRAAVGEALAAAGSDGRGAAEWTASLLAHDVLLVRLSDHLGIDQRLTASSVPAGERERLLAAVRDRGFALEHYELPEPRRERSEQRHQLA